MKAENKILAHVFYTLCMLMICALIQPFRKNMLSTSPSYEHRKQMSTFVAGVEQKKITLSWPKSQHIKHLTQKQLMHG